MFKMKLKHRKMFKKKLRYRNGTKQENWIKMWDWTYAKAEREGNIKVGEKRGILKRCSNSSSNFLNGACHSGKIALK